MKKIGAVLAASAAILGGTMVLAPGASASGYGCSGSDIGDYSVRTSTGTLYATAHLYYDSSTGYNCAVTVASTAGGYGVSHQIEVYLSACTETSPDPHACNTTGTPGSDNGSYTEYAGPVKVHAPGRCIYLYAEDDYNWDSADYASGAFHCG